MENNRRRHTVNLVVFAGGVAATIILAQNKRIQDLEKVVDAQKTALQVTQRSLFKAGTMMTLPQLLGLVEDTINDAKFHAIVKNG